MSFNVDAAPYQPRMSTKLMAKHHIKLPEATTPPQKPAADPMQAPPPANAPSSSSSGGFSSKSPKFKGKPLKYTQSQLLAVKKDVWKRLSEAAETEERVDHPPFHGVPKSFVPFFNIERAHLDIINWESPLMAMNHTGPPPPYDRDQRSVRPRSGSNGGENADIPSHHCITCANIRSGACDFIASVVQAAKNREKAHGHGFLSQGGEVIHSAVALLLTFDHRQTSRKMKKLAEKYPKVKSLVNEFLCGEGFHIPPPNIADEEAWGRLISRLRLDWIRDNRTKVYTELSKYWKRSHTQFEQFAHLLFYRDAMPNFQTKGMITHSQKPVLVACIAGDVDAVVLLAEMGFFVLADVFWDMLPYFKELNPRTYTTLRHLCVYYFKKQQRRLTLATSYHISPALPPMAPMQPPPSPSLAPGQPAVHVR